MDDNKIKVLGYDDWFNAKYEATADDSFSLCRVIEVNKNNYKISNGILDKTAELSGRFLYNVESNIDYPTVGDWVEVQLFDDNSPAIIHSVLPRKTLLKRKASGKTVDYQLIGANIDYAFIVQAVDSDFNLNRLERYFVMAGESNIQPIVVLSKIDLISENELADIIEKIDRFNQKYLLLPISSVLDDGLAVLEREIKPGKTYCLLGSSGVGKTTLLNKLLGENRFSVGEVREKDNKGRHTTTRRQLTCLKNGGIIIDTPGMRELGNIFADGGLNETFDEIALFAEECRFKDCTHVHEKGCAVRKAVNDGIIDKHRYKNYLALQKESAFCEMSYLD